MRRLRRHGWLLFAGVVALLAIASVTVASVRAHANGCIFNDGTAYCHMAMGKLAPLAWSRRVVVPAVVSWLPHQWSVVDRFELVALVAAAGATIASGLLAYRIVRYRATPRLAYPAALCAASVVAVSPHLFRLALTTPVLVDQAAIFFGLVWCLLATARTRWLRWMSPLLALVLVPTREAWLLPLLLATGVMVRRRQRALAAATLVAALGGGVFTLTRPSAPGAYNDIIQILHVGRLTLTRPDHALWSVAFGAGFAAFVALPLLIRWRHLSAPTGVVLAVAVGLLVQAPLGGVDISRYAAAALPFGVVLATAATVESGTSRGFWALVGLTAATLLLWQPFRVTSPGASAYFAMYYPGQASTVIALGGLILVAAALIWVHRPDGATAGIAAGTIPSPSRSGREQPVQPLPRGGEVLWTQRLDVGPRGASHRPPAIGVEREGLAKTREEPQEPQAGSRAGGSG